MAFRYFTAQSTSCAYGLPQPREHHPVEFVESAKLAMVPSRALEEVISSLRPKRLFHFGRLTNKESLQFRVRCPHRYLDLMYDICEIVQPGRLKEVVSRLSMERPEPLLHSPSKRRWHVRITYDRLYQSVKGGFVARVEDFECFCRELSRERAAR